MRFKALDIDDDDDGLDSGDDSPSPSPTGVDNSNSPTSQTDGPTTPDSAPFDPGQDPLGLFSNKEDPWHLLDDLRSNQLDYHLMDPTKMDLGDIESQFPGDASAFYDNESALKLFGLGKDKLSDFIPSMDSIKWGLGGAAIGGAAGLGIGAATDNPELIPELMEVGQDVGFEVGFEAHELWEDFTARASGLYSLLENTFGWPDSPGPPQQTSTSQDILDPSQERLK